VTVFFDEHFTANNAILYGESREWFKLYLSCAIFSGTPCTYSICVNTVYFVVNMTLHYVALAVKTLRIMAVAVQCSST